MTAPFTDWCAHGFTAERYRYVIVTNTHSLFSAVTHGAGITSEESFIRRALDAMRGVLHDSGRAFAWEQHIAPAIASVQFAKLTDRRVMGSMNDLIYMARNYLIDRAISPVDLSAQINKTPMSYLWKRGPAIAPDRAFDQMIRDAAGG
ncbi:MAG: hypothetical protein EXS38_01495 [Opitutus sp.]|nr:hypothetical protein [Opitutus sp.]